MSTPTLIIVDVQNDFCPGGALAVPDGDKIVEPLNRLAIFVRENGGMNLTTRDWHPEKTKHFAKDGGLWPVHCVGGTGGANFHPDLRHIGWVFDKGFRPDENAYSAFDAETLDGTKFIDALKLLKADTLYVGGLATDYCVKATVLDAIKYGFKTVLLTDAIRAVNINPGDGDKAIAEMVATGVILATTEEVMNGRQF